MRSRSHVLASGVVAVLLAPSAAHAQEYPPRNVEPAQWASRPVALVMQGGVGSPLGVAGAAVEVTPVSFTTVRGGVGVGLSGPQLAGDVRVRPFGRFGIGAGVSTGRYVWSATSTSWPFGGSAETKKTWDLAWFGNAEVSYENRYADGLQWRVFLGAATVLNPGGYQCSTSAGGGGPMFTPAPQPCSGKQGAVLPYLGGAVGWGF